MTTSRGAATGSRARAGAAQSTRLLAVLTAALASVAGLMISMRSVPASPTPATPTPATPTTATPTTATPTTATPTTATPTTGIPTTGTTPTSTTLSSNWRLLAGGDSLLTRSVSAGRDPFAKVNPPLASAELAIINVETAISNRGRAAVKTYTFRSAPAFAGFIAANGVDVASLANNHSLDFGPDALSDTISALRTAGVTPIGAGADENAARQPARSVIGGVRVSVLAASQIIPNGTWPAGPGHAGVASAGKHRVDAYTRALIDSVRSERAVNDVVIVFLHWGIEGSPCPSPIQRQLAALLHDAGATVVIGAHPHVLQPIERTPDGGLTAFSLGNFIWDPRSGSTADTGVLEVQFSGSAVTGVLFHPHRLDGNGWAAEVNDSQSRARITGRVERRCGGR